MYLVILFFLLLFPLPPPPELLSSTLRQYSIASVYADVQPMLESWKQSGKTLSIYSSGSVDAQKLYFSHTIFGNILHVGWSTIYVSCSPPIDFLFLRQLNSPVLDVYQSFWHNDWLENRPSKLQKHRWKSSLPRKWNYLLNRRYRRFVFRLQVHHRHHISFQLVTVVLLHYRSRGCFESRL